MRIIEFHAKSSSGVSVLKALDAMGPAVAEAVPCVTCTVCEPGSQVTTCQAPVCWTGSLVSTGRTDMKC